MSDLTPILADTDDIVKVVIGIVVFIIWGIGALVNMLKKQGTSAPSPQAEAEMQRAMQEQIAEARRREAIEAMRRQQAEAQRTQGAGGGVGPYGNEYGGPPPLRQVPMPPPPPVMQQPYAHPDRRGPAIPPVRQRQQQAPSRPPQVPGRRAGSGPIVPPRRQPRPTKRREPVELPEVPLEEIPRVTESAIGTGDAPASPARREAQAARANAIQITSATLRQQFILTEILQPPLALRERQI